MRQQAEPDHADAPPRTYAKLAAPLFVATEGIVRLLTKRGEAQASRPGPFLCCGP
ncbi:hypothetical protein SAMN00790413_04305 [Deinococcus hopiensis KR-140]|uniref:Uncharacterized protein n=1 Tax=Deinococcus hopiensis KR-140 TaxID=695939 RepID=A0A1W1UQ03_9DEIO|nr:hypothetical protein SAMN00790413_04305 [Deinococcus hopiensis KR-140]